MIHNKLYRPLFVLLMLIGVISACTSERTHIEEIEKSDIKLTFSLDLPRATPSNTRSLTVADENNISEIDVLVFKNNEFEYLREGKSLDNSNTTIKTFEVTLPRATYDLVFIANARQTLLIEDFKKGDAQNVVLASLEHSLDAKWTSNEIPMWGFSDAVVVDENTSLTGNDAVKMSRMLAKIEVKLSTEAQGDENNSNFAITSLHLYNYNTVGKIVNNRSSIQWDGAKAIAPNLPTDPNTKRGPLVYTPSDDTTSPKEFFTPSEVRNTIYTFEAEESSQEALLDKTCLVIGGSFKGSAPDTHFYRVDFVEKGDTDKYLHLLRNHRYTIMINKINGDGLSSADDAFKSGPLNIEADVHELDEGDLNDVVWDGQSWLAVSQGEYNLLREPYDDKALDNILEIKTNWKDGWEITSITDENNVELPTDNQWLTVVDAEKQGEVDVKKAVSLLLEENTTGAPRIALINIQAGRLKYQVKVNQSFEAKVSIWVEDEQGTPIDLIDFVSVANQEVEPRTYKVRWLPKDANVTIELSSVGSQELIKWHSSSDNPETAPQIKDGSYEFTVKPQQFTDNDLSESGFASRYTNMKYTMTVNHRTYEENLLLGQFTENLNLDIDTYYLLDGNSHKMTVYSAVPWKLVVKKNNNFYDEKKVITKANNIDLDRITNTEVELASGRFNLPHGSELDFTTVKDFGDGLMASVMSGDFHLELKAIEGPYVDNKEVFCASAVLQKELSNCYILDPTTGAGLLIPVKRANGYRTMASSSRPDWTYGDQITTTMQYGSKLVWSDAPGTDNKGLAKDGGLFIVESYGRGSNGHILVMPGLKQKEGNALVAVTDESDKILWNWHVWLTDAFTVGREVNIRGGHFNTGKDEVNGLPGGNLWMDRNLGALRNGYRNGTNNVEYLDSELIKSFGLYYVFGLNIPFPRLKRYYVDGQYLNSILIDTFDSKGSRVNFSMPDNTHANEDIRNAIRNPLTSFNFDLQQHPIPDGSDWYSSTPDDVDFKLWQDEVKTINDPCPSGWRVPRFVDKEWNDPTNTKYYAKERLSQNDNLLFSINKRGFYWPKETQNYKGGFYPLNGFLFKNLLPSPTAVYWSSTYRKQRGFGRSLGVFNYSFIDGATRSRKSFRAPIRCVRE